MELLKNTKLINFLEAPNKNTLKVFSQVFNILANAHHFDYMNYNIQNNLITLHIFKYGEHLIYDIDPKLKQVHIICDGVKVLIKNFITIEQLVKIVNEEIDRLAAFDQELKPSNKQ